MQIYTILPNKIYQSAKTQNMSRQEKEEKFKELGISIIVNLWHTRDEEAENLVKEYFHIPVPDGKTDILGIIEPSVKYVCKRIKEGEVLLSHCYGGRNRSGLFNAMVLVELGYNPELAVQMIKEGRPNSLVNESFVASILKPSKEKQLSILELLEE